MNKNYARFSLSVTEAQRRIFRSIEELDKDSIAILKSNKVRAYIVPAEVYEDMIDTLETIKDNKK